jgi:hypothetical protein
MLNNSNAMEAQQQHYYYTLSDVLDTMAAAGQLGWRAADGRPWLALETREQFQQVRTCYIDLFWAHCPL